MKNILIIGAGAIGSLIGAALVKAGLNVTFAGKPHSKYTKILQTKGVQLYYPDGKHLWISSLHPQVKYVDTATYLDCKFDGIFVALKSNHLIDVIPYIKAHATPATILVHAQNGIPYWWFNCDRYLAKLDSRIRDRFSSRRHLETIDPHGILTRQLSQYTSVGCVIKAPCQKNTDGKIFIKKAPRLILGFTRSPWLPRETILQQLCDLFNRQGIQTEYTIEIRTAVCNKLAINIVTNVLSALTGKVIAELTSNTTTNNLIKTAIAEINYLFAGYGIPVADLPTEAKIYSYIKTPGSQSHLPSLAQDFSQHKPGEVSLITAIVEMAEIARLKIPTLASLSELLQLAQVYSLNSQGKSNLLTLDDPSGCCTLTKDVCQSSIIDRYEISNLISHLVRVNVSAFGNR